MNKKGLIIINDIKYNFIFCDYKALLKINPELLQSIIKNIQTSRNERNFNIERLLKEEEKYKFAKVLYFFIYLDNSMISCIRLIYTNEKNHGYLNMILVNENYRGKKICQNSIKYLIKLTNYIKLYELEVRPKNIAAIKCYEKIGFTLISTLNKYHLYSFTK